MDRKGLNVTGESPPTARVMNASESRRDALRVVRWTLCVILALLIAIVGRGTIVSLRKRGDFSRRIISARRLFDSIEAPSGATAKFHAVYDFSREKIVLLRTDGESIEISRSYDIPDTKRFHVRFYRPIVLNSDRFDHDHSPPFVALDRDKLVDAVSRDDDIFAPIDLANAWGGKRLLVGVGSSPDVLTLRFDSSSSDDLVSIRIPSYLNCHIRKNSANETRLVFETKTPCDDAAIVKYGDYSLHYVNKLRPHSIAVPERSSPSYNKIVPYMRWIYKDATDSSPAIDLI